MHIIIDNDLKLVNQARVYIDNIYYADATFPQTHKILNVNSIRCVIIALTSRGKIQKIVKDIKFINSDIVIFIIMQDMHMSSFIRNIGGIPIPLDYDVLGKSIYLFLKNTSEDVFDVVL